MDVRHCVKRCDVLQFEEWKDVVLDEGLGCGCLEEFRQKHSTRSSILALIVAYEKCSGKVNAAEWLLSMEFS